MVISKTLREWFLIAAAALCLPAVIIPATAQQQNQDEEVQMGQEVFNELKAKGEIIESSPLYDQLKPIADAITKAAQPRYNHPFKFYLVHETQPNAFATPGGNVYVVDSLLYFVKNQEELAGTLCHEVSHTIHRDTVALMEKQEKLEEREIAAAVLMGPTRTHVLTILLLGKLHSLSYSRDVESRADLTGSEIRELISGRSVYLELTASIMGDAGPGVIYYDLLGTVLCKTPKGVIWHGTWKIEGNTACTDWKESPKNPCTRYDKRGDTITTVNVATGVAHGKVTKIVPGNAEMLTP